MNSLISKYKLLIVDDELPNLRLLERLFRNNFHCLTASNGDDAIRLLEQHDVAIVITDQRMPQLTGIELLKRTAELRPHMVRILLTGYTDTEALVEAINCGLVYMYVTKPWNNDELKLRVNRALEHYVNNRKRSALEIGNARLETKLEHFKTSFIRTMAQALKARDESLYEHSWRVSCYGQRVAEVMNLGADLAQQIAAAAMLHDFTALCHPADVFCNQTLPWGDVGNVDLFSLLPEFTEVSEIIRFQLENFDGSGGPRGLIGDQIPLGSRILRAAAEYDLMTTSTLPLSHGQAVVILEERSGHALDPQVVEVFLANVPGIECSHLAVN